MKISECFQDIMGTDYLVKFGTREELGMNQENIGECKTFAKQILICTEPQDCNEEELKVRTQEIIAHELFHAFINETGIELDDNVEELIASFYMKNFEKMHKAVWELYRKSGV